MWQRSSSRSRILLEAEIKKLLPERKGTTDIYAIGIAGWSDQDVFIKELNGGLSILNKSLERGSRYDAARQSSRYA